MERLQRISRILTVLLVISALAAMVSALIVRSEFRKAEASSVEPSRYEISYPDDPYTVYIFYRLDTDRFLPETPQAKREYFALARYLEASIYYDAFVSAGMEEEAARYAAVMEENEAVFR